MHQSRDSIPPNGLLAFSFKLAVLAAAICCAGCKGKAPEAGDVWRIGEVGSMTGNEATFGISTHNGVELAFKEINEKGGVKGKKLEAITLDDRGRPEEAATAVTRLITQDNSIAILGEVASSRSIAMAPVAQRYKVPMISPSSTNPKVTEMGDYIFRVCFIDPFQGQVMARFAANNLKAKNVAILRDLKNDYSVGLANFFTQEFVKNGGKITADISYSAGDTDFKAQLTNIKGADPDAIFVPGYYTEVGLIARQAREIGIKAPLLGGDGWESPRLYEIGGQAIEGSYFSTHYSPEDSAPIVQDFVTKYRAAYGQTPDGLAAAGYDAAKILADSMERAADLTGPALRDAISQTKNFKGVTGTISIDEKRNAKKSATVLKVSGGKPAFETTIQP